jgi:hypothetical protein
MTKLLTSFAQRAEHVGGALELLWTILCWAAAFSAVVVTTAVLVR